MSEECGVRSEECGVRSVECGVRSVECSLPLYWGDAVVLQILVAAGELMLTEPAATISREGGGVDTLEDEVALAVDHICFSSCIAAPKHVDEVLTLAGKGLNGCIGKVAPA